jgi:hypothetical protein
MTAPVKLTELYAAFNALHAEAIDCDQRTPRYAELLDQMETIVDNARRIGGAR